MLVSIDVGIKRLGFCILEAGRVKELRSIDLCPPAHTSCNGEQCRGRATFLRADMPWCRKCALAHPDYHLLADTTRGELRHANAPDLRTLLAAWGVTPPRLKTGCLEAAREVVDLRKFFPCRETPASKIGLVEVGRRVRAELDALHAVHGVATCVAIENQIGPASPRMKGVQCMVAQYYIMRDTGDIRFVASTNKLRGLLPARSTYAQRKQLAIKTAEERLSAAGQPEWLSRFLSTTRKAGKADMADAYLQGLWVLEQQE
jgi:hypothetical protein